jgi:hypothetical protein
MAVFFATWLRKMLILYTSGFDISIRLFHLLLRCVLTSSPALQYLQHHQCPGTYDLQDPVIARHHIVLVVHAPRTILVDNVPQDPTLWFLAESRLTVLPLRLATPAL